MLTRSIQEIAQVSQFLPRGFIIYKNSTEIFGRREK